MTDQLQVAVRALKKFATKGKTKVAHLENIESISSATIVLNSSSPSSQAFSKLASLLRGPFVPLYASYTEQALKTAAAILDVLLKDKIHHCLRDGHTSEELQEGWQKAAYSLLSGVIDYLEGDVKDKEKTAIAKTFYSPLCDFFSEKNISFKLDMTLRSTAYMLLSDSAASHPANQALLRTQKVLGGKRLGLTISQTKDYVVLEALLNLFARLLPSSTTKDKRSEFILEVFAGKAFSRSETVKEIQSLLACAAEKGWEETATNLLDIFASVDISFPQPFDVKEVLVCGNTYPQPSVSDRFYIDRLAFFINVEQEDGLYESLQVYFSSVQQITMVPEGGSVLVTVNLNSVPRLANQPIANPTSKTTSLDLFVMIRESDVKRFVEALKHRNLDQALKETREKARDARKARVSVTEASARLEFQADGKEWESEPPVSIKVKEVESFYNSGSDNVNSPRKGGEDTKSAQQTRARGTDIASNTLPPVNTDIGTQEDESEARKVKSDGKETSKGNGTLKKRLSSRTQLHISVFGDAEEAFPDISEVGQGVPLQVNDDDSDCQEILKPATKSKKSKMAYRRTCSESMSEASGLNSNSKRTIHASRPSLVRPVASSTAKKRRQELSNAEDVTDQSSGKPPALRKPNKQANTPDTKDLTPDKILEAAQKDATDKDDKVNGNSAEGTPDNTEAANVEQAVIRAKIDDISTSTSGKRTGKAVKGKKGKENVDPKENPPPELPGVGEQKIERVAFKPAHHSSPLSRVSRMKARHGHHAVQQEKTKTRKRPADETVPLECPPSPKRKKPVSLVPEIVGPDSGRVSSKTRGKATKENAKEIDWEQIPSSDVRDVLQPSSPTSKVASKKAAMRNARGKPTAKPDLTRDIDTEELKPVKAHKREPLREKDKNVILSELQPAGATVGRPEKKSKTESFKGVGVREEIVENATAMKLKATTEEREENTFPSLEDVLLRGATLSTLKILPAATRPDETVEEMNEANDFQADPMTTPDYTISDDLVQAKVPLSSELPAVTDILDSPRPIGPDLIIEEKVHEHPIVIECTPSPKKLEVALTRVIDQSKSKTAASDDGEPLLLTEGRSGRMGRNIFVDGNKCPEGPQAFSPLAYVSEPKRQDPIKLKVKFDEKSRYKSASFENLVERAKGRAENYYGEFSRKRGDIASVRNNREHVRKDCGEMKIKEPGMNDIISVINSIQDVVISNIANKSRAVRSDIRIARDRLLYEASADLQEMHAESIQHYNNLISLETEYANASRKLVNAYEVVENINGEILTFVQQSIKTHDRKTSSRNLPHSLFASGLPSLFKKLTG